LNKQICLHPASTPKAYRYNYDWGRSSDLSRFSSLPIIFSDSGNRIAKTFLRNHSSGYCYRFTRYSLLKLWS